MIESNSPYLTIVIPAYNEECRVEAPLLQTIEFLRQQTFASEIICIDDGSSDGTLSVLKDLAEHNPVLDIISYERNRGKGYAVKMGVLAAKGSYILFSDADMNTPVEEMSKLFEAIKDCDIAIGSRAWKYQDRPWVRELGSRFLNRMIQLLAVPGIRDTQCGFKLFKSDVAKNIFRLTFLNRFSFDIEVLYLARLLGYRVREVPVEWYYRGGSKVRPVRDGLLFLRDMLRIRRHQYDLKRHDT